MTPSWIAWRISRRLVRIDDVVLDRRRVDHDLDRRDASLPADARDEALRDHGLQVAREHAPDLVLLVRRVVRQDALDRLHGVHRVQRGDDEVTGVRRGQRDGERLDVADLADHDDVGILPQHVPQAVVERVRVLADLALVDQALVVAVEVLDRVLDA